KDNVSFEIIPGLDLRGGLRLVYTVEVEEAIRDRRDRRDEEMRLELAKLFELQEGDDRPTEETIQKLRELVVLEAPRSSSNEIKLRVTDKADPAKIDARFLGLFANELSYSRSDDMREISFRV